MRRRVNRRLAGERDCEETARACARGKRGVPRAASTQGPLDRFFGLSEAGASVGTELRAGLATFRTTAYIIFVNPAILEKAGMDYGAVFVATCRAASRTLGHHGDLRQLSDRPRAGHGAHAYFAFTVVAAGIGLFLALIGLQTPTSDRRFKEINAAVAVVALAFLFKLILA